MAPQPLTPEQKKASIEKRKQYQKEYQKSIPIELVRVYNRRRRGGINDTKQLLKNQEISI